MSRRVATVRCIFQVPEDTRGGGRLIVDNRRVVTVDLARLRDWLAAPNAGNCRRRGISPRRGGRLNNDSPRRTSIAWVNCSSLGEPMSAVATDGGLGQGGRCGGARRRVGRIGILERARPIGRAPHFALREFCELERRDGEIGIDPLALNFAAGRGREAGGGQPDRAAVTQRDHPFDRALAKGLGADQHRAVVVLQRAGDEFGLLRRAAVDERNQRPTLREIARSGADRGA